MTLPKTIRSGLSLLAMTVSVVASVPSAYCATPLVPWSSVRQVANNRHRGVVTSTFVQPDPAFSGSTALGSDLVDNIPSFTNTSNQTQAPGGLTGLNIPSAGQGLLPSTGQLRLLGAFYSTPSTSTNSADDSLFFVVQTEDGLYHQASFTTEHSDETGTNNGRRKWVQYVTNDNTFAPALGKNEAGRIRKEAIIFTGAPNSDFDSINQILPPAIKSANQDNGFFVIDGTKGGITTAPKDLHTKAHLKVVAHPPDQQFNFEF